MFELFDLQWWEWGLALFASFLIGAAKSGLKGIGAIIMTLMALVFGAKASTGIVVPLLIAADILAVRYYRRSADWRLFWRFVPFMMAGVLVGVWVGKDLDEQTFKYGMAAIILVGVAIMAWNDMRKSDYIPDNLLFASVMGLTAGFTTMIGNLAGAFSNIFFLAMRVPKAAFIGTAAWIYFIVNIFKVPFHIWSWGTISMETFKLNLVLIPVLVIGFFIGVRFVDMFSDKSYRRFILVMTAIGAVLILLR